MGFRPTISSLMRSKTGPILVVLQIAVTLAIVINSLFIVVQRVEKMNRDPGMDVNNVIVTYVRGFGEGFDVANSIINDLDLIKSIPGVVAATVSNQIPLSGSGSGTGLRTVADETVDAVNTARYRWDEEGLNALGVELSRGGTSCRKKSILFFPHPISAHPHLSSSRRHWRTIYSATRMHWDRRCTGDRWSHQQLSALLITCMAPG